jgi:ketosteroid isomerase-like protein
MSQENVALILRGYEAYARKDFQSVFALLHPEVENYQTELLPWGGLYKRHEQAREFFRKLNEQTEGWPEPTDFIPAGDKEGQVVRFAAYIDTPGMLSALGAG